MSGPRLLGLDLAWSPRNPSGLAVLDAGGRLLDARADLRTDDEIVAWVGRWIGSSGILAFDMPTIVRNPTGQRPAEAALRTVFGAHHAGPHPANRGRPDFANGGRARALIDRLGASHGVVERLDIRPGDGRNVAIEVFPHPAHVRLFERATIFKYKKKPGRCWPDVLAEWTAYRSALASLTDADPPLFLDASLVPETVGPSGYKRWDDTLDAISCAYIAAFVYRWGIGPPHVRVFGDLVDGYIVVPDRSAFGAQASGVRDACEYDKNQRTVPDRCEGTPSPRPREHR